ncbi:NfeD family protein [Qipengyuania sediminis]|uniref:NfeD family protein n=1 Tax=Qipengyuania sediminis TaxID=1532023 RepID=UPI001059F8EE|nr:NfeD family protein [Qipengyuania sediminis]
MDGIESHWLWIGAGLILAALEMLVPGVYLIWLALAAIATGVLVLAVEPPVVVQIVSFVSLSLIFAFSTRRFYRDQPIESTDPLMNNRAGRLIGQSALVTQAIEHGDGRIKVGDSEWLASGPDCPAGTCVRIAGAEGARLTVEALELPSPRT